MVLLTPYILTSALALGTAASPSPPSIIPSPLLHPRLVTENCTIATANKTTALILREYLVETVLVAGNVAGATQLRGTFTIENPAAGGDTYRLYHIPVSTGGGTWGVCQNPREAGLSLPAQLAKCQYLIERPSKRIGFRFQWYCNAPGSTNRPILFDATAIGELTELCQAAEGESAQQGVTQACTFPAGVKEVELEVENMSWEEVEADGRAIE